MILIAWTGRLVQASQQESGTRQVRISSILCLFQFLVHHTFKISVAILYYTFKARCSGPVSGTQHTSVLAKGGYQPLHISPPAFLAAASALSASSQVGSSTLLGASATALAASVLCSWASPCLCRGMHILVLLLMPVELGFVGEALPTHATVMLLWVMEFQVVSEVGLLREPLAAHLSWLLRSMVQCMVLVIFL